MSDAITAVPPSAIIAGYIASMCFTVQYIPQTVLNYRRKSVTGFSSSGTVIKLAGASFLCVNAYLTGEHMSVVMYGLFNVVQHLVFVSQFATYTGDSSFFTWFLLPLLPLVLGTLLPESIAITSSVKPLSQLFSHLPQLYLSWTKKTTEGVSLSSQHLNVIGGFCGLYMSSLAPTKSIWTSMVYVFSFFQASSLYALVVYFDGWEKLFQSLPLAKQHSSVSIDAAKDSYLDPRQSRITHESNQRSDIHDL